MAQPGSAALRDKGDARRTGDGVVDHSAIGDAGQDASIGLGCTDCGEAVFRRQEGPDYIDVHARPDFFDVHDRTVPLDAFIEVQ
jgi:hypothetical protein